MERAPEEILADIFNLSPCGSCSDLKTPIEEFCTRTMTVGVYSLVTKDLFIDSMGNLMTPDEFKENKSKIFKFVSDRIYKYKPELLLCFSIVAATINWKKLFFLCYDAFDFSYYWMHTVDKTRLSKEEFKSCVVFALNCIKDLLWFKSTSKNICDKYKLD